jgi:hypothetical protein
VFGHARIYTPPLACYKGRYHTRKQKHKEMVFMEWSRRLLDGPGGAVLPQLSKVSASRSGFYARLARGPDLDAMHPLSLRKVRVPVASLNQRPSQSLFG